ncbi:MAG: hypothetical protein FD167_5247 [bacterium]|nr:MAG: hypothetical protein FD167_5247 [bacterium]
MVWMLHRSLPLTCSIILMAIQILLLVEEEMAQTVDFGFNLP